MPKGSSGKLNVKSAVKRLLEMHGGKSKQIDHEQFTSLRQAESAIRDKPVEHAIIFDHTGKTAIAAFEGSERSVGIPNSIDLKGKTMTHNHPDKKWGGTLSFADIGLAATKELKSLRAVGRKHEGEYVLTRGKSANSAGLYNQLSRDRSMLENKMTKVSKTLQTKVSKGEITEAQADAQIRQRMVGILHSYYKKTMHKYGFEYARMK